MTICNCKKLHSSSKNVVLLISRWCKLPRWAKEAACACYSFYTPLCWLERASACRQAWIVALNETFVRRLKRSILQRPECWNPTSSMQAFLSKQRIYLLCTAGKYKGRSPLYQNQNHQSFTKPVLLVGREFCQRWLSASGGCGNMNSATTTQQHYGISKASLYYKQHNELTLHIWNDFLMVKNFSCFVWACLSNAFSLVHSDMQPLKRVML